MMELATAPPGVFENNQAFLPITNGLTERSQRLLEISVRPSRKILTGYSLDYGNE
jgi:hypothetical protein